MFTQKSPIGVLDSGVGGLSVLKWLRTVMPGEDFIYVGDTARAPYGVRPEEELRRFMEQMLCYFDRQGVKLVVIACNTLTVLGVPSIQKDHKFSIVGMSMGTGIAPRLTQNKKVAVFATPFTVSTGRHRAALTAVDPEITVTAIPCPKFVVAVEHEELTGEGTESIVAEYAQQVRAAGADTVLLSCTHFPFLREMIARQLGSAVTVADPAEETAQIAKETLAQQGLLNPATQGSIKIGLTADIEKGKRLAAFIMPDAKCSFSQVEF